MPPNTRSVVRRRNWRWSPGNEHTPRGWVCFPGPGTAVAEFDTLDAAEADWGKRESDVRRKMNPFECGPLPMVSSLPDPILRDFLMDTGIDPPAPGVAWDAWWTANRDQLSDEQQARLWEATDKVRFFEITEEIVGPEVHVVVDVNWEERGGLQVAEWDGGSVMRVCRHLGRAEEIARSHSQQRRFEYANHLGVDGGRFANCRPSNVPDPFNPGAVRLTSLTHAPFFEVITIPFDDTEEGLFPRSEQVFVVVRTDYVLAACGLREASPEAGMPLKAFADWEKAREFAAELELMARATFNPFCMGTTPEMMEYRGSPIRFADISRELGLSIPHEHAWENWWDLYVQPLPRAKRDRLWDLLWVQFYTVVSVAVEG